MMQFLQFGSPTLELFAASYNNRSNKSNIIQVDQFENLGYTQNSKPDWIKKEDNYGIYNKYPNDSYTNWIASPDTTNDSLFFVGGHYGYIYGHGLDNSNPVRPIVGIPTSIFNNKYTLADE